MNKNKPGNSLPDAKKKQRLRHAEEYIKGILKGNRILLSQAITLAESTRPEHQEMARRILDACLRSCAEDNNQASLRIGITGSPGAGKSSFIETFGTYLTSIGRKVAVLAIDPTSQVSKGSILGDKTRMSQLSANPNAFIRPSPSGSAHGGVAARTRETMLLCEAAGFDTVFVETVGVGQSETAVHGMVDFFLLLLQPGAGDELQGIKRGIVEMADLIAVNKADGDLTEAAKRTALDYSKALHLFPVKRSGWTTSAVTCSATTQAGIEEIWKIILDFQHLTQENGWFTKNRKAQLIQWLYEHIERTLKQSFYENKAVNENLGRIEKEVTEGKISSSRGAEELMRFYNKQAES